MEIVCVDVDTSSDYYNDGDCRCIDNIGYENIFRKEVTPAEMHDMIQDDGDEFYVWHNGEKTEVEAENRGNTKYVRTEPNSTKDDNLLHQDSC